jgi:hypothetical protein
MTIYNLTRLVLNCDTVYSGAGCVTRLRCIVAYNIYFDLIYIRRIIYAPILEAYIVYHIIYALHSRAYHITYRHMSYIVY